MVFRLVALALLLVPPSANCDQNQTVSAPVSPYTITQRGPHHRIWQRVTTTVNKSGQNVSRTNSYTELATGLNHLNGSEWVDSSAQIQITPNGASATNTQYQVTFAPNLNTAGAINLATPDGKQMTSHVVGLAYSDAVTGQNVLFAETQDSTGQLLPTGDQIIYTNAFTHASCDVLYTHRLSGFEQDIVIRQQLPAPYSFGLTGSNLWLQVWTEFTAAPSPQITPKKGGDSFLDFGAMKMGPGKAFMFGASSNAVPVTKEWVNLEGRTFLVESVLLNAVAAKMSQLPSGGSSSGNSSISPIYAPDVPKQAKNRHFPVALASLVPPHDRFKNLKLPPAKKAIKSAAAIHLASGNYRPAGLVLDYNTINGGLTDFIFQGDTTYYVSGTVGLLGTTTIEGGTCLKFDQLSAPFLAAYGTISCKTSPYRPAVLTSSDDDTVGEAIAGSAVPRIIRES